MTCVFHLEVIKSNKFMQKNVSEIAQLFLNQNVKLKVKILHVWSFIFVFSTCANFV